MGVHRSLRRRAAGPAILLVAAAGCTGEAGGGAGGAGGAGGSTGLRPYGSATAIAEALGCGDYEELPYTASTVPGTEVGFCTVGGVPVRLLLFPTPDDMAVLTSEFPALCDLVSTLGAPHDVHYAAGDRWMVMPAEIEEDHEASSFEGMAATLGGEKGTIDCT